MTKVQTNFQTTKRLAEYLDDQSWDFFLTGSTGYSLSLPSARRLAERYFNMLPAGSQLFYVSEKFECKDGYHIHGLLKLNKSYYSLSNLNRGDLKHERPEDDLSIRRLSALWQTATGNKRRDDDDKWEIWNQIDLSPYMKSVGASGYCAKYINKKRSDYDLFINSQDPGPDTAPVIRPGRTIGIAQLQDPDPVYRPRQKSVTIKVVE